MGRPSRSLDPGEQGCTGGVDLRSRAAALVIDGYLDKVARRQPLECSCRAAPSMSVISG